MRSTDNPAMTTLTAEKATISCLAPIWIPQRRTRAMTPFTAAVATTRFCGGDGIDQLFGDAGNDVIAGDLSDTIDGGDGIDTVILEGGNVTATSLHRSRPGVSSLSGIAASATGIELLGGLTTGFGDDVFNVSGIVFGSLQLHAGAGNDRLNLDMSSAVANSV